MAYIYKVICKRYFLNDTNQAVIDTAPITVCKQQHSANSKVGKPLVNKGYCASKKMYCTGVKLQVMAQLRDKALPFPFDYTWSTASQFKTRTDELARLENVYAGAALIKKAFPDVTHVSEAMLEIFRIIPPTTSIRTIVRFVRRLDQVQYGKVTVENLPSDWIEYLNVSPAGEITWNTNSPDLREKWIKIV